MEVNNKRTKKASWYKKGECRNTILIRPESDFLSLQNGEEKSSN